MIVTDANKRSYRQNTRRATPRNSPQNGPKRAQKRAQQPTPPVKPLAARPKAARRATAGVLVSANRIGSREGDVPLSSTQVLGMRLTTPARQQPLSESRLLGRGFEQLTGLACKQMQFRGRVEP